MKKQNKKELLKSVVDPLDREYVKHINLSDYTRDDNNNAVTTNIDPFVLRVINDVNNNNEINDDVTVKDIKTEA